MKLFSQRMFFFGALLAAIATPINKTLADVTIDLPELEVITDNVNPVNGFFDVFLTLTAPDLGIPVTSFDLEIFVSAGNAGLTFGAPVVATASPLFPVHETVISNPVTLQQVQFSENIGNPVPPPDSVAAFNGAGLVRIPFTIAPGNFGQTWTISITPGASDLFDGGGIGYSATLQGGSISAVPEAAAWQLLLLVSGIGTVVYAFRKRTSRPAAVA